jgi:hypothetical protein
MAESTDITLPKGITPVFPDLCIVCHAPPDSTTTIAQNSQHFALTFFFPILLFFGWSRTEVPICRGCKPRFYFQRWGRTAICWGILFAVAAIAWPHFAGWGRLNKKIALGGIALVAIVPYVMFELFWPRSFDTMADGDEVTYQFGSETYAKLFYLRNREHVLKSDIEFVGDLDENAEWTEATNQPSSQVGDQ